MGSFAEGVIRAFESGRRARMDEAERARQQMLDQQAAEDRKLQRAHLQNEMQRIKIADLLAARQQRISEGKSMQGQPGPPVSAPSPLPWGAPMPLPGVQGPLPAVTSPAIPELNLPEFSMVPQNQMQVQQAKQQEIAGEAQARAQATQDVESKAPITPIQQAHLDMQKAQMANALKVAQIHANASAMAKRGEPVDPQDALFLAQQVRARQTTMQGYKTEVKMAVNHVFRQKGWELPRQLTPVELNAQKQAADAISSLGVMDSMLQKHGQALIAAEAVPGIGGRALGSTTGLPVSEYRAVKGNVMDIISRIRTGAQINKEEWTLYNTIFAPKVGDDAPAIEGKMNQLKAFFWGMTGAPVQLTDPKTGRKVEITDMYTPKVRVTMRQMIQSGWVPELAPE